MKSFKDYKDIFVFDRVLNDGLEDYVRNIFSHMKFEGTPLMVYRVSDEKYGFLVLMFEDRVEVDNVILDNLGYSVFRFLVEEYDFYVDINKVTREDGSVISSYQIATVEVDGFGEDNAFIAEVLIKSHILTTVRKQVNRNFLELYKEVVS